MGSVVHTEQGSWGNWRITTNIPAQVPVSGVERKTDYAFQMGLYGGKGCGTVGATSLSQ